MTRTLVALCPVRPFAAPKKYRRNLWRLPRKFQRVPRATIKFVRMEASGTDIEALLGVGGEGEDD